MTRSDLIAALASRFTHLTAKDAEIVVKEILDAIGNSLAHGDRVEIRGFGSFVVRDYESYTGRNPKTGMNITVSPKRLPFFKVGKELRDKVNLEDEEPIS